MKIGFIGTGVMGAPMVLNLLKSGHEVKVYNRTEAKAAALCEDGAILTHSIAECVDDVDVVITIVGYPKDVKEVYDVIIDNANAGVITIDMTTSSPELATEIYQKAKAKGIYALDAPVSGGDINYLGNAGSGQHCKMANQTAIAGAIAGAMEAMTYAIRVGLDLNTVLKAISKGSAGSFQLDMASSRVMKGDYAPGFYIKHFIKDMRIAQSEAERRHLVLPVLAQVLKEYEELQDEGYGDLGTQALYKYYSES